MGNCGSSPDDELPVAELQSNSYDSMAKWKEKLTTKSAREIYTLDGTIPRKCTAEVLELRVHLSELILLKPLLRYAQDFHDLNLFSCWADIMEFRNYPENFGPVVLALNICHHYLSLHGTRVLPAHVISEEMRAAILARMPEEVDVDISKNTFDELLHLLLAAMYNDIFTPYKQTPAYVDSLQQMKSSYNNVTANDFIYLEELGRGGFGCVVHCRRKSTGVNYAMKIQTKKGILSCFRPDYKRVTCELEALASCNSPFIVGLEYAFQTSSLVMLVMEMGSCKSVLSIGVTTLDDDLLHCLLLRLNAVAGTLSDSAKLCKNSRMPQDRVLFYAPQLVLGLEHLHSMGLIYRDLKPSNVLLCSDGYVKLADLGGVVDVGGKVLGDRFTEKSSALFSEEGTRSAHASTLGRLLSRDSSSNQAEASIAFKPHANGNTTINLSQHCATLNDDPTLALGSLKRANSIMGTGGYMAPEMLLQVFGVEGTELCGYTNCVDFWSLGVTLFKLLTGKVPFSDEQIASLVTYLRWDKKDRAVKIPEYVVDYENFLRDSMFSHDMSSAVADFLVGLFSVDVSKRLGAGANGAEDIKKHRCFETTDWRRVKRKAVLPLYIPDDALHSLPSTDEVIHESFFDMVMSVRRNNWDMSLPPSDLQACFSGWDYVSPGVLRDEVRVEARALQQQNRKSPVIKTGCSVKTGGGNRVGHLLPISMSSWVPPLTPTSKSSAVVTPRSTAASATVPGVGDNTSCTHDTVEDMMSAIERKCVPVLSQELTKEYDRKFFS